MNFTLGLLDVGDMMQDAVTEHQVEGVIGERQVEDALPQFPTGEGPAASARPGLSERTPRSGRPRTTRPIAYQAFRLRSLTQSDLEHPFAGYIQGIDACRWVALVLVSNAHSGRSKIPPSLAADGSGCNPGAASCRTPVLPRRARAMMRPDTSQEDTSRRR